MIKVTSAGLCGVGLILASLTIGCAGSKSQILATDSSQVELRAIQSRTTEIADRERILRVVMATLQDLSFVIDSADFSLGTVTATKLDRYALRMTVTVREWRPTGSLIRASAQYNNRAVEDPEPYQNFFEALSKSEFLELNMLD